MDFYSRIQAPGWNYPMQETKNKSLDIQKHTLYNAPTLVIAAVDSQLCGLYEKQ